MLMRSQYFDRKEFQCNCGCGFDTVDTDLLEVLIDVRTHFHAPVIITSGCRCEYYNEEVNGSKNSQHLYGTAADIYVVGKSSKEVYEYLEELPYADLLGLGLYVTWVHVDVRGTKARWDSTE